MADEQVERQRVLTHVTSRALASFSGGMQVSGEHQPAGFGRYRILRLVDWQPDHAVFVAHDPLLDRRVTLELFAGADAEQLLASARKLATLTAPSIAAVYTADEVEGVPCLVCELVEGPRLSSWAATQRWPERLQAYLRVGEGLAAAHRAGVELGFSPEHVVVTPDGRACIVDLGRAGSRVADGQTDQSRFCRSLWAALFGSAPADASIPTSIAAALTRGLASDPEQRFASMAELLVALAPEPLSGRDVLRAVASAGRRAFGLGLAVMLISALAFVIGARVVGPRSVERPLADALIEVASRNYDPAWERATSLVLAADAAQDAEASAREFLDFADRHGRDPEHSELVWRTGFGVAELLSSSARAAMIEGDDERARALFEAGNATYERTLMQLDGAANGRRAAMVLQGWAVLLRDFGRLERDPGRIMLARSLEAASVTRWFEAAPPEIDPYVALDDLWPLFCSPPESLTP